MFVGFAVKQASQQSDVGWGFGARIFFAALSSRHLKHLQVGSKYSIKKKKKTCATGHIAALVWAEWDPLHGGGCIKWEDRPDSKSFPAHHHLMSWSKKVHRAGPTLTEKSFGRGRGEGLSIHLFLPSYQAPLVCVIPEEGTVNVNHESNKTWNS